MKMKDLCLLPWSMGRALLSDFRISDRSLSRKLEGLIRSRELRGLLQACDSVGVESTDFPVTRQLAAFFKKNDEFSIDMVCISQAQKNFEAAERRCRITNKRIDHYVRHPDRLDPELASYVASMQKSLLHLLGSYREALSEVPENLRVTSGATEDRARARALPFLKISGKLKCPSSAFPLIEALMAYWEVPKSEYVLTACEANRVEFVPKNYKTHRTIACEPTALLPLQLAFDAILKARLMRWGVNLHSQVRNQNLALRGSVDGSFATLDLEAASDSLALNTVCYLFPEEWLKVILRLRCGAYHGTYVGSGYYSKYASMGNGVTFALETLVFAAAVRAVGCRDYAVYGDDIVVESEFAEPLTRLLRFLGFRLNTEKSFVTGPFRESCGVDALNGRDITPFYLRTRPTTGPEVCHVINGLARIGYPGSKLWSIAWTLQKEFKLPLVPSSDDTMSGVHIDHQTARKLGKIVCLDWVEYYRGFMPTLEQRTNRGWRAYLLYFLQGGKVSRTRSYSLWHDAISEGSHTTWTVGANAYRYDWRRLSAGPRTEDDLFTEYLLKGREA